MTIFGKLEENELRIAPKVLINEGKQYINPSDELYISLGYLPIEYTNAPEYREGYHNNFYWLNMGNKIQQVWQSIENTLNEDLVDRVNKLETKIALTPITYIEGMEVDEKKLYTDGKIILRAIASGTPTGLNDTNFFD